jgi:hypothetical protein
MSRKKVKIHEESIELWHLDNKQTDTREYKLLYGLAEEEDFNDLFATSCVTDDEDLLCFAIGV